jgi:hypothetical protein
MAFSVNKSRPFRSLGLYKSSGKHAAPKGYVPEPRPAAETANSHRPAHAATMPRLTAPLTGPLADADAADAPATDAGAADTEQSQTV